MLENKNHTISSSLENTIKPQLIAVELEEPIIPSCSADAPLLGTLIGVGILLVNIAPY